MLGPIDDNQPLNSLIGTALSGVVFTRHYIQLAFDGPLLNMDARPTIQAGKLNLSSGESGFRDALCERIGVLVAAADVQEGIALSLTFADGSVLTLPLTHEDKPYAAEFRSGLDLWEW